MAVLVLAEITDGELAMDATATWSDCVPGCAVLLQSLMQTLAGSGYTKTEPFHNLHQHLAHKEGPSHYEPEAGIEHKT